MGRVGVKVGGWVGISVEAGRVGEAGIEVGVGEADGLQEAVKVKSKTRMGQNFLMERIVAQHSLAFGRQRYVPPFLPMMDESPIFHPDRNLCFCLYLKLNATSINLPQSQ